MIEAGRRRVCTSRTSSRPRRSAGTSAAKVLVPTEPTRQDARRRPPRRRRARRADGARGAHRRTLRRTLPHERRGRA
jgi:hypothetical protein